MQTFLFDGVLPEASQLAPSSFRSQPSSCCGSPVRVTPFLTAPPRSPVTEYHGLPLPSFLGDHSSGRLALEKGYLMGHRTDTRLSYASHLQDNGQASAPLFCLSERIRLSSLGSSCTAGQQDVAVSNVGIRTHRLPQLRNRLPQLRNLSGLIPPLSPHSSGNLSSEQQILPSACRPEISDLSSGNGRNGGLGGQESSVPASGRFDAGLLALCRQAVAMRASAAAFSHLPEDHREEGAAAGRRRNASLQQGRHIPSVAAGVQTIVSGGGGTHDAFGVCGGEYVSMPLPCLASYGQASRED